MQNKTYKFLLVIIIFIFIFLNYNTLDSFVIKNLSNEEIIEVERVVDGDTVIVEGNSFRLLGINTPERGEYLYLEAKEFLEKNSLNKSLKVERKGQDRYQRELVYLYEGNKNLNLELVEEGYANYYFPSGKDRYYNEFVKTWEECIKNNKNLCEKSLDKCSSCVELYEWDFTNQKIVLRNKCSFDCSLNDWTIKDEGRKKFVFDDFTIKSFENVEIIVGKGTNTNEKLYWGGEEYVWTSSGDTIFIRDNENKLVLWKSQNY